MNETYPIESQNSPISADLLEILRDPKAIQEGDKYGPDPGRLELVRNSWLVSRDTGYKYPIRDGIPVMLIEEGEKWKDTAVDALPVPPPAAEPAVPSSESQAPAASGVTRPNYTLIALSATAAIGIMTLLVAMIRRMVARRRN
jgi:uncharacterized protein YbaR (Trm112 family)